MTNHKSAIITREAWEIRDACSAKSRGACDCFCPVYDGPMWEMLGPCWHVMLVFLELFGNISQHRDVEHSGFVIPLEFYAPVKVPVPIFGEFVVFLEACY